MKTANVDEIKKKVVPILKEAGVTRSSIFGSYVRGEANKYSDIDILVISKDFIDMDDNERLDFLYKKTVGLPLDWHIYGFTPDEIEKVSPLNTLSEALRTGKQFS